METNIAIVYFGGYGHTKKQAEAVEQGAKSTANTKVESLAIDKEGNLSDADWATLAKANAIIFGSPTYMGGPAWQFKKIADLIPLLLAGAVTLEVCVIARMALNFANVIALPLLLGVGVAFKIYYIMAWRAGHTGLLQSALTRAIAFSAMTNAVVFGTLLASTHPGMSSLGKLMVMPLVCTMAFAVVFQPVLMGHPREIEAGSPVPERFLS